MADVFDRKRKKSSDGDPSRADGVVRVSGIDVLASVTASGWPTGDFSDAVSNASRKSRAHTTCPRCASSCAADATVCWNCGTVLQGV